MAKFTRASDGDLFSALLARLEEALPDYENLNLDGDMKGQLFIFLYRTI